MYAHEVIETIKSYKKDDAFNSELLDLLKNSVHFFMGNEKDIIKFVFNGKKERLFSGCCDVGVNIPYSPSCFHFSTTPPDDCHPDHKIKKISLIVNKSNKDLCIFGLYFYEGQGWANHGVMHICVDFFNKNEETRFGVKSVYGGKLGDECVEAKRGTQEQYEIKMVNFALMLLNTKNITTIDNPPPAKLNKKRIKNGKQPLFTYKTLRLQLPAKKRKKGSGLSTATDNTTRLHLCRGHFKTYTEDKPLLGKFTGRYWWQPHARGDKSQGVVMKDYEVKI